MSTPVGLDSMDQKTRKKIDTQSVGGGGGFGVRTRTATAPVFLNFLAFVLFIISLPFSSLLWQAKRWVALACSGLVWLAYIS